MTVASDPPGIVLEGFAGPGGWSTGLAMILCAIRRTLRTVGVEWDTAACKTAHAAGHARVRADVARFDLTAFAGLVWLLILSPPCQAWSRSGKRRGILDQAAIFAHAMRVTTVGEWIDYTDAGPLPVGEGDEGGTWHDARSPLVLEVLRWVLAVQPANICLEQVPDVLPFWELIARWLRSQGYSVWTGCLSAERYGVPQTRERAILIASRERAVSAPPATHTAYDSRLADGGKWHGTEGDLFGGGLEPWVSMAEALGWGFDTQPAPTVTAGGTEQGGVEVFGNAGTRRRLREVVVRQKHDYGAGMVERHGDRPGRAIHEPSLAVTAGTKGSGPRLLWVHERPATTVQGGDPRIAQPGHRDREGGERQFAGESIRITVEEAAALQSFPPGYPWHGRVGDKHRQVGDAVPPLLAAHVIAACLGVQVESLGRAA